MARRRLDTQGWAGAESAPVVELPPPAVQDGVVEDAVIDDTETALRVQAPPSISMFDHFEITKTSLKMKSNATFDEWIGMGSTLRFFEVCIQFAMGDWMNSGEGKWGDKCAQVIDSTEFSVETVRNYAWVSAKVPPENRLDTLPFTFHQAVAGIESHVEQKRWLDRAVTNSWTVSDLKKAIKAKQEGAPETGPSYTVIVDCTDEDDMHACCRQLENLERKTYRTKVGK